MKKKQPLPPSAGEMLPVKTRVVILRPNMWANLAGEVETFGNGIHLVRTSYPDKPGTFLVAARLEEMRVLTDK